MNRIENRCQSWRAIALVAMIGAAAPARAVGAQTIPALESRWWPSIGDAVDSRLAVFGNLMQCRLDRCDQAASLGVDARLLAGLHVAAGARKSGFDYGASYAWRRVGIGVSMGEGTSLAQITVPRMQQTVRNMVLEAGRVGTDTVFTPIADSTAHAVVPWSSAETRLTWREDRWWVTALIGRVAVARQGASLWSGLQLGADIGRGAALLLSMGATSRPVALAGFAPARHSVSLGLGFNAAILSPHRDHAPPKPSAEARSAFDVSSAGAGRIRITIRVPSASVVAFASDCTGWKAVDMTQTRDGWVVDVAATRGLHHANIRVDGGRWIAPPGLAALADEFAGEVGTFVVE